MDITITGRNAEITDRFRDYATEKSEKVASLADRPIAFEVKLSRRTDPRSGNSDDKLELMLFGPGPLVKAESSGPDKYAAFDLALDKLLEQVRTAKDRRKVHRGLHRQASLSEMSADGFSAIDVTPAGPELLTAVANGGTVAAPGEEQAEEEYSPVVIRRKVFPATRLTSEEAVDHMELVGHDFFLFIDAETGRPSVVYRRKGWAYGVIALDDTMTEADAKGSARG